MVRELSKHQSASCLIVSFVIVRFVSLSCYSSAKTRIQPVKSYQINKSFCSITHCASLRLVYRLIAVSTHFRCPELQVRPLSSPRYSFFEPEPEPDPGPAFEPHFRFFNHIFPLHFCMRYYCTNPFGLARACKSHLTSESFTSYLTNSISLTTALVLLAK